MKENDHSKKTARYLNEMQLHVIVLHVARCITSAFDMEYLTLINWTFIFVLGFAGWYASFCSYFNRTFYKQTVDTLIGV